MKDEIMKDRLHIGEAVDKEDKLVDSLSMNQSMMTMIPVNTIKGIAKDHSKSLVRSSTCLVILDYFHFTPLVLIEKKKFSETRSKTRSGDL